MYSRKYGFETKIARCFAFVGPYLPLDRHFAIGNFIRDGLNDGPIHVKGDGTPFRSYLYAADLAVWLWTILFRGETCRPYNVGSETGISIKSLADMAACISGNEREVIIVEECKPGRISDRYVPSTQRARNELGLSQEFAVQESMSRTAAWYRNTLEYFSHCQRKLRKQEA